MAELLDDKKEIKETAGAAEETQIIPEVLESEPDFKPKIVKIPPGDRVLARNHVPDMEKEGMYFKETGEVLGAVLYNPQTKEKIELPAKIGQVYRHAIRKARERYQDPSDKNKRYETTQKLLLNYITKKLSDDDRRLFQSGTWEVRSKTTVKAYERLMQSVFNEYEPETAVSKEGSAETAEKGGAPELISFKLDDFNRLKDRILESGAEIAKVSGDSGRMPEDKKNALPAKSLPLNRLQNLRLAIGRAMQKGEGFDKVASDYKELHEYTHWYLVRHLGIIDLFGRMKKKEIEKMPEKVLSIASGPYAEAEANENFADSYASHNLKQPDVVSFDLSEEMLRPEHGEGGRKKDLGVRGTMLALPFRDRTFDFAENTSMHFMKSAPERETTLKEMRRVVKDGGLMRIIYKEEPPEGFYEELRECGWEVMTLPKTHFNISEDVKKILKELVPGKAGEMLAKRAQAKARNDFYILAKKIKELAPVKRINWKKEGTDLEREALSAELRRRAEFFETAVKNEDLSEIKNLFWEFGRRGRETMIGDGFVDLSKAEALPNAILLKRMGSRKFEKLLEAAAKMVWPKSRLAKKQ